jgi:hypothetical protein
VAFCVPIIQCQEDLMQFRKLALAALSVAIVTAGFAFASFATEVPEAPLSPETSRTAQAPVEGSVCSLKDGEEDPREQFGETIGALVEEKRNLGGYVCECAPGGYPGCPSGKTCVVSLCFASSSTPHIRGLCL